MSKLALIIGNSEYKDEKLARLNAPEADVEALAAVLRDSEIGGFDDVIPLVNQTEGQIRREIVRFFRQAKSKDLLLLYFSGHGVLSANGQLYLATPDTEYDLLEGSSIPAALVRQQMDDCNARQQLLILDCCNSGAFKRAKGSPGSLDTKTTFEGRGRVILTASDEVQIALESDGEGEIPARSVFTHHLIEGLQTGEADRDQDGQISVQELYDYTFERVMADARTRQRPYMLGEKAGQLFIASAIRLPTTLLEDLNSDVEHRSIGAVHTLGGYLQGENVRLARLALDKLAEVAGSDRKPSALRKLAAEQLAQGMQSAHRGVVWGVLGPLRESDNRHVAEITRAIPDIITTTNVNRLITLNALIAGHTNEIRNIVWSPDSKQLASVSLDDTVKLWDASSGKQLSTLEGDTNKVVHAAWAPDGKQLAAAGWSNIVRLWDTTNGKLLHLLKGHTDFIWSVTWSPDGTRLASISSDNSMRLWNTLNGKMIHTFPCHTTTVVSITWLPDRIWVASANEDNTIQLRDIINNRLLHTLKGHTREIYDVAWSPDNTKLASTGEDNTVGVWDAGSGELLHTFDKHHDGYTVMYNVAWSPDGTLLASANFDQTIWLCDIPNNKLLRTIKGHATSVVSVAWSPDGTLLASGSGCDWDTGNSTIRIWGIPPGG